MPMSTLQRCLSTKLIGQSTCIFVDLIPQVQSRRHLLTFRKADAFLCFILWLNLNPWLSVLRFNT